MLTKLRVVFTMENRRPRTVELLGGGGKPVKALALSGKLVHDKEHKCGGCDAETKISTETSEKYNLELPVVSKKLVELPMSIKKKLVELPMSIKKKPVELPLVSETSVHGVDGRDSQGNDGNDTGTKTSMAPSQPHTRDSPVLSRTLVDDRDDQGIDENDAHEETSMATSQPQAENLPVLTSKPDDKKAYNAGNDNLDVAMSQAKNQPHSSVTLNISFRNLAIGNKDCISGAKNDNNSGGGEVFPSLRAHLRLENLTSLALAIRTSININGENDPTPMRGPETLEHPLAAASGHSSRTTTKCSCICTACHAELHPLAKLTCTLTLTSLSGSYHLLYPVTFSDGVKWIFKFPSTGHAFLPHSALALHSEAHTQNLVREITTIPIPRVWAYDHTADNPAGAPYILMEFVSGIPLYELWFDMKPDSEASKTTFKPKTPAKLDKLRKKILDQVAGYMLQLDRIQSPSLGTFKFGDDGEVIAIAPLRICNRTAGWATHNDPNDNSEELPIWETLGPYSDVSSWLCGLLSLQEIPTTPIEMGLLRIMHLFINQIAENCKDDRDFYLRHPDFFQVQNFLVDKEGVITGIIDWDGIAAMPLRMGNRGYPGWLTTDWDPVTYEYKAGGVNPLDNSPEELKRYRRYYHETFVRMLGEAEERDYTKGSMVYQAVETACTDPACFGEIMMKLLMEIMQRMEEHKGKVVGREEVVGWVRKVGEASVMELRRPRRELRRWLRKVARGFWELCEGAVEW